MPRVTKTKIAEKTDQSLPSIDCLRLWPMLSRRRLLSRGLYSSAGLVLSKSVPAIGQAMASPPQVRSEVKLARYVDALPIPPVIRAAGTPGEVVDIEMREVRRKGHRHLPRTTLCDYDA